MRVTVRLFAMQRELVGARTVELELPAGATVEDAWAALAARHPGLAPGRVAVRFALNGEYAEAGSPLEADDEVSFIPPVSGGSGERDPGPDRRRVVQLADAPFDPGLADRLSAALASDEDGAVVAFTGRTRRTPGTPAPGQEAAAARHAGRSVESLEYEAHEEMALDILGAIADEIEARFGVVRLAIVHRTGEVPLGEPSVLVVAASPHRDAAFAAARYAIDETKARAPIWKAEHFAGGHVWTGAPARTSAPDERVGGEGARGDGGSR